MQQRLMVQATVVGVNDGSVLYPACLQCYAKMLHNLHTDRWQCMRCNMRVMESELSWRYRLSLSVCDMSAMCSLSLFGGMLGQHFGCPANTFHRFVHGAEGGGRIVDEETLQEAAQSVLVGSRYIFCLKTTPPPRQQASSTAAYLYPHPASNSKHVSLADLVSAASTSTRNKVDDGRLCDFVAVQMIPVSVGSGPCAAEPPTVLSALKRLLGESQNCSYQSSESGDVRNSSHNKPEIETRESFSKGEVFMKGGRNCYSTSKSDERKNVPEKAKKRASLMKDGVLAGGSSDSADNSKPCHCQCTKQCRCGTPVGEDDHKLETRLLRCTDTNTGDDDDENNVKKTARCTSTTDTGDSDQSIVSEGSGSQFLLSSQSLMCSQDALRFSCQSSMEAEFASSQDSSSSSPSGHTKDTSHKQDSSHTEGCHTKDTSHSGHSAHTEQTTDQEHLSSLDNTLTSGDDDLECNVWENSDGSTLTADDIHTSDMSREASHCQAHLSTNDGFEVSQDVFNQKVDCDVNVIYGRTLPPDVRSDSGSDAAHCCGNCDHNVSCVRNDLCTHGRALDCDRKTCCVENKVNVDVTRQNRPVINTHTDTLAKITVNPQYITHFDDSNRQEEETVLDSQTAWSALNQSGIDCSLEVEQFVCDPWEESQLPQEPSITVSTRGHCQPSGTSFSSSFNDSSLLLAALHVNPQGQKDDPEDGAPRVNCSGQNEGLTKTEQQSEDVTKVTSERFTDSSTVLCEGATARAECTHPPKNWESMEDLPDSEGLSLFLQAMDGGMGDSPICPLPVAHSQSQVLGAGNPQAAQGSDQAIRKQKCFTAQADVHKQHSMAEGEKHQEHSAALGEEHQEHSAALGKEHQEHSTALGEEHQEHHSIAHLIEDLEAASAHMTVGYSTVFVGESEDNCIIAQSREIEAHSIGKTCTSTGLHQNSKLETPGNKRPITGQEKTFNTDDKKNAHNTTDQCYHTDSHRTDDDDGEYDDELSVDLFEDSLHSPSVLQTGLSWSSGSFGCQSLRPQHVDNSGQCQNRSQACEKVCACRLGTDHCAGIEDSEQSVCCYEQIRDLEQSLISSSGSYLDLLRTKGSIHTDPKAASSTSMDWNQISLSKTHHRVGVFKNGRRSFLSHQPQFKNCSSSKSPKRAGPNLHPHTTGFQEQRGISSKGNAGRFVSSEASDRGESVSRLQPVGANPPVTCGLRPQDGHSSKSGRGRARGLTLGHGDDPHGWTLGCAEDSAMVMPYSEGLDAFLGNLMDTPGHSTHCDSVPAHSGNCQVKPGHSLQARKRKHNELAGTTFPGQCENPTAPPPSLPAGADVITATTEEKERLDDKTTDIDKSKCAKHSQSAGVVLTDNNSCVELEHSQSVGVALTSLAEGSYLDDSGDLFSSTTVSDGAAEGSIRQHGSWTSSQSLASSPQMALSCEPSHPSRQDHQDTLRKMENSSSVHYKADSLAEKSSFAHTNIAGFLLQNTDSKHSNILDSLVEKSGSAEPSRKEKESFRTTEESSSSVSNAADCVVEMSGAGGASEKEDQDSVMIIDESSSSVHSTAHCPAQKSASLSSTVGDDKLNISSLSSQNQPGRRVRFSRKRRISSIADIDVRLEQYCSPVLQQGVPAPHQKSCLRQGSGPSSPQKDVTPTTMLRKRVVRPWFRSALTPIVAEKQNASTSSHFPSMQDKMVMFSSPAHDRTGMFSTPVTSRSQAAFSHSVLSSTPKEHSAQDGYITGSQDLFSPWSTQDMAELNGSLVHNTHHNPFSPWTAQEQTEFNKTQLTVTPEQHKHESGHNESGHNKSGHNKSVASTGTECGRSSNVSSSVLQTPAGLSSCGWDGSHVLFDDSENMAENSVILPERTSSSLSSSVRRHAGGKEGARDSPGGHCDCKGDTIDSDTTGRLSARLDASSVWSVSMSPDLFSP